MGLCACFRDGKTHKNSSIPHNAAAAAQHNGSAAVGSTATPLDRISPDSFASANSFASAQSFLSATSNMTGTTARTATGGGADRSQDGMAGLPDDHKEALTELRRRVAAPQATESTNGGNASLAERLRHAGEVVDDACLRRWLVARTWVVDKAEHSLQEHATWRLEFPNNSVREDTIEGEMAQEKVFVQGCDIDGHPVQVILAARHKPGKKGQIDETRRFITYCLDHTVASATKGADKFVTLFDLTGFGYSNLDFKALLSCFDLLQNHYPERLAQLWFLNAPGVFWGLWKMVSPFIDAGTREKISFVKGEAALADLRKVIPAEVLPKQFGGEAELIRVQDSKAALVATQQ